MFDAALKLAEHRFGHVRPAGELDTLPLPPTPTVRRNRPAPNVAVTLRAASSVTAHGARAGAGSRPAGEARTGGWTRDESHRQAQIELDIAVLCALKGTGDVRRTEPRAGPERRIDTESRCCGRRESQAESCTSKELPEWP